MLPFMARHPYHRDRYRDNTIAVIWVFAGMKHVTTKEEIILTPVFKTGIVPGPEGLYYDKTHTWAFMEKEGLIRVGIDDFLQHVTGTITRVIMKEPGETLEGVKRYLP